MIVATDIVLDAAKAADPEELRAALERLSAIARTRNYDEIFGAMIRDGIPSSSSSQAALPDLTSIMSQLDHLQNKSQNVVTAHASNKTSPLQQSLGKIQAYFLQTVLSEIMPKNELGELHEGYADDMWRSVASEQIANQLAKQDILGFEKNFAPQLARGYSAHDKQPQA